MKFTLVNRAAPLLITTMLVAAPAWAQSTAPGNATGAPPAAMPQATTATGPSGTSHKGMPTARADGRQPGETMQAAVERRITDLHSKLHITSAQSQQWDQFAQAMRGNAREMDDIYRQRAEKLSTMSAVDNMQSYAQIEQQRAQDMQKLVPAFQTLYASLSDQQKKLADDMFRERSQNAQARHRSNTITR